MKIEVQWFLEGIWRKYKVKKIHLKFQGITKRKNAWKRVENCRIRAGGAAACTLTHGTMCPFKWNHEPLHTKSYTLRMDTGREYWLLVFQDVFGRKPYISPK